MMIDADICIKLGGSDKYLYLEEIVPMLASEVFMHKNAFSEVMMPQSATKQLRNLVARNKIKIVDETILPPLDRAVYDMTFLKLERVMIDPRNKNKNRGEVCSLSYAKAIGIPVFATDEMDLQIIIDAQLNNGIADIKCLRIIDIIKMAHDEVIPIKRKIAKALWLMSGKKKELFDQEIWPQSN
jgi:hypothetical protein